MYLICQESEAKSPSKSPQGICSAYSVSCVTKAHSSHPDVPEDSPMSKIQSNSDIVEISGTSTVESLGICGDSASLTHSTLSHVSNQSELDCGMVEPSDLSLRVRGDSEVNSDVMRSYPCDVVPRNDLDTSRGIKYEYPNSSQEGRLNSSFETASTVNIPCSDLESSFYVPTSNLRPACDLGKKVFLCDSSQVQDLINKINVVSKCTDTPPLEIDSHKCRYVWFEWYIKDQVKFQCSGCGLRQIIFNSSSTDVPSNPYRSHL